MTKIQIKENGNKLGGEDKKWNEKMQKQDVKEIITGKDKEKHTNLQNTRYIEKRTE